MPLAVLSLVNILFLAYWSFIWLRSFRKHRDGISMIVFLFVAQGFIKEIWAASAAIMAVSGVSMERMTTESNLAVKVVATIMLISIQVMVGKLNVESKNDDNDRRPDQE